MYLNGHTTVTIAGKVVKTVVSVKANNDSRHIGASCDVVVPLNCRIQYKDGQRDYLTALTKTLFKVGDEINITAYYDGYDPVTVFNGFVYDFVEGNPTTIKCADYVYKLNQTTLDISYKNISLVNLIKRVLDGTGVTLLNGSFDFQLVDITFRLMSPAAILEWIKKELGLNISLSGNQLYVNLASNTLNVVHYRTDRNVIGAKLQKPDAIFKAFKLKAWFVKENGTKDSLEVGNTNGLLREVYFYKVTPDQNLYKKLAKEALLKFQQYKYGGYIETLLYPDVDLFWKAIYEDIRYPDRSGNYVVTGIETTIDEHGYHRKVKLAFLTDVNEVSNAA